LSGGEKKCARKGTIASLQEEPETLPQYSINEEKVDWPLHFLHAKKEARRSPEMKGEGEYLKASP